MIKYYDYAVTFSEFPDEITLCVNISNCPGMCSHCSEPWLLEDVGKELTNSAIDMLIATHPHITVFGLMGGDSDHNDCIRVAKYIKEHYPELKIGMYSGREFLNLELAQVLDYYKIGRWIMPEGSPDTWHKKNCGVLQFPWSNQLLFQNVEGHLINITYKFREKPLGDLTSYIITD